MISTFTATAIKSRRVILSNVLVYDAGGKLVAEYGSAPPETNGTQFVTSDHQGSPRTITNNSGAVVSRHDYAPFGEDLPSGVGMRTPGQNYSQPDSVRQKYAGMENDDATGMSHTLWRQYDSRSGRWTAPDPYGGSMDTGDPQTFNRYSYVENDPVNQTDPLGLMSGRDASQSWGDVAGLFWGASSDFGGPTRQDHIAAGMARHDSIRDTGYDPAFDIYRGDVEVQYIPDGGGFIASTTLHNPTPGQILDATDSLSGLHDDVAQRSGKTNRSSNSGRSNPKNDPRNYRWVPNKRGGGQWQYTGAVTWREGLGRSPLFGDGLRFRGLAQNRPLGDLTHNEIYNAFRGSGFTLSSHAVGRFKDQRTYDLGIRTLNDYANSLNTAVRSGSVSVRGGNMTITHGRFETVMNIQTGIIITFKPR